MTSHNLFSTPIIMDIEASGFGANSYPIEVGVVLGNGIRYCRLIRPEASWTHWDLGAQKLHGISREVLQQHGQPISQICAELNQLLAGKTAFSDGWVVDKPWLLKMFFEANSEMQFTLSPLEMILAEAQMNIWHDTKDTIRAVTNITRHRASADAELIQHTYLQTRELINPLDVQSAAAR